MKLGALSLYENALLFGHDATPHLVAFERSGESEICCYVREGGRLTTRRVSFRPFLLLQNPSKPGRFLSPRRYRESAP